MKRALSIGCGIVIGFVILGVLGLAVCSVCVGGATKAIEKALATSTPSQRAGESRLYPLPVGSGLVHGDRRLTVLRSYTANKVGYSTLDTGKVYRVVVLKLDCLTQAGATCRYGTFDFRLVGSKGIIYGNPGWPETEYALGSGELFGGSSVEGELVWEVDEEDSEFVLIWSAAWGQSRYLAAE